MIDGGIRKAQKDFVCHRFRQFVMVEEIRQQPVSVIPADRTQDHVNLRIPERLQQVFRPLFRMVPDIFQPLQRMGHELYVQAVFFQPAQADFHFIPDGLLPCNPAGQAYNCNIPDHFPLHILRGREISPFPCHPFSQSRAKTAYPSEIRGRMTNTIPSCCHHIWFLPDFSQSITLPDIVRVKHELSSVPARTAMARPMACRAVRSSRPMP